MTGTHIPQSHRLRGRKKVFVDFIFFTFSLNRQIYLRDFTSFAFFQQFYVRMQYFHLVNWHHLAPLAACKVSWFVKVF